MTVGTALLLAYLDGELEGEDKRRVETALASDEALRTEYEAQRGLREKLLAHYDPALGEPVPARLRAMLEPMVVDLAAARQRRQPRRWLAPTALAASLVIGLAIGRLLPAGGEIGTANGALIARGELGEALDTQLASSQAGNASTRIGVSFARADGTMCRTFANPNISGLACHEGEDWRLVAVAAPQPGPRGDYRQAGGAAPLILQAAQEMMAGEPFDAAAERRARDGRWRSSR